MKKLVIYSGGLDSTAIALIANKENGSVVTLMTFDYGQKAKAEIDRARVFAEKHGMNIIIQDISSLKYIFGNTQLTDDDTAIQGQYNSSVVVPLRNAMFLQVAMIYAYTNGYDQVLLGSHLDDCKEVDGEMLFPDCSPQFFRAFEDAMDKGTFKSQKKVQIVTASTCGYGKTDLIRLACEIDAQAIYDSWSCYASNEHQCGECDSCKNRKAAFKLAGIEDKTIYQK